MRLFAPWNWPGHVEDHKLPPHFQEQQGWRTARIGDVVLSTIDTTFAAETCEELFTPNSPHITMALNGVEICTYNRGSHHSLCKLDERIALISEATRENGGVYLHFNQIGCDGDRLCYYGCAMIFVNGNIVRQSSQFSLNEVEVVTAAINRPCRLIESLPRAVSKPWQPSPAIWAHRAGFRFIARWRWCWFAAQVYTPLGQLDITTWRSNYARACLLALGLPKALKVCRLFHSALGWYR